MGAPMVAVMSYRRGSATTRATLRWWEARSVVNTHPVTVVGIAPPGFYGDRMTSTPPDFYIPMAMEPVLANCRVSASSRRRMALYAGAGEAGDGLAPLQEKMSGLLRQLLATVEAVSDAAMARSCSRKRMWC